MDRTGNNETQVYIDGCLEATSDLSACTSFLSSDRFYVGNHGGLAGGFGYDGSIDELQIHDESLSASDIRQIILASGGTPTCVDPPPPVPMFSAHSLFLLSGSILGVGWWLRRSSRD